MKSTIQVYATFDCETTGLKSRSHYYTPKGKKEPVQGNAGIIEIAICPMNGELEDLPEYNSGIISLAEDREINQGALDANGISREQIKNGKDPKEVAHEIKNYFKKLNKTANKIILCGHNIDKFDIPFFVDFLSEQSVDLSKLVNEDYTIDTMWRAREVWPEQVNYKLGTCCQTAGISLMDAHRAINDTRANKELVKYLLLGERGQRGSGEAVEENKFRKTFEF